MSSLPPLTDDDDLFAAELALGLLEPAEQRAAEARLAGDPAFAAAYRQWQHRAVALADGRGEAPPEEVWRAIQARLPANDQALVPRTRLRRWQTLAGSAAAAAIVLGVIAFRPMPVPPAPIAVHQTPEPPLVAVLSDAKRDTIVTVSIDHRSGSLSVVPHRLNPGRGDAELWVISGDGRPRALGVIDAQRRASLTLRPGLAKILVSDATLAVSLEPRGGSPTGLPTGPVILTGKIAQS